MSKILVVRRPQRQAVMLPLGGTKGKPNIIIPLYKLDRSELDELIRGVLEKLNLSKQEIEQIVEQAEIDYEHRIKTKEASVELHKRIREQDEFSKLKYGGLPPPKKRR